jgi:transcriptional regulator with XRE-family HTH domain
MQTELGELIRRSRRSLGWTLQELARRMGYRNLAKGARRLEHLEQSGMASTDLEARAASALGLDQRLLVEIKARDDAARAHLFQEWLEGAQPMELYGYVAGATFRVPLPERLTEDQAIAFAMDTRQELRVRMCLVVDRKRSFWISSDGTTYLTQARAGQPNCPYSTVG